MKIKFEYKTTFAYAAFIILTLFLIPSSHAVKALDTQYAQDGIEVHLLKANVSHGVLTTSFMFENTSESAVIFESMVVSGAHYTTADKKYPVLKDTNGKWLASTITYNEKPSGSSRALFTNRDNPSNAHTIRFDGGAKRVGWVKFEAPTDDAWPIELTLPGVSPFTIEKPE